ncbi:MAG: hypothetical protein JW726_04585, partial [Anaerolineales bacterium]|nr:hypothetical protein [Anaerolineales bacterium]
VLGEELVDIVLDELNVKVFEFVAQEGALVQYKVLPDNKLLGPRFGARFPLVRAALQATDPTAVATSVRAGLPVTIEVEGGEVELAPQEVLVQTEPAPGLAVAADKFITVGIDAAITPQLRTEGLARELTRRIQDMRKSANFKIEERITTWYAAERELAGVFEEWGAYIQAETLTTLLVAGEAEAGAYVEEHELEGGKVRIGIRQN